MTCSVGMTIQDKNKKISFYEQKEVLEKVEKLKQHNNYTPLHRLFEMTWLIRPALVCPKIPFDYSESCSPDKKDGINPICNIITRLHV